MAAAFYFAWLWGWRDVDLDELRDDRWDRVAFACRYGNAGGFCWDLEPRDLIRFNNAVARLLESEHPSST